MEERRIEVMQKIEAWNNIVKEKREALVKQCLRELGYKGNKIPTNRFIYVAHYVYVNSRYWFMETRELCNELRSEGWDVKMVEETLYIRI